jgi:hypothetical protein
MSRSFAAAILLCLTTAGISPISAQATAGCVQPKDACAFFTSYLAAFNHRDWQAFRATFADDITVMFDRPAPPERQTGRAAVEAMFSRVFPAPGSPAGPLPPPLVPEDLLAQDLGDAVVISFIARGPGVLARRSVILHRTPVGWRVAHIHASSSDIAQ